MVDKPEDDHVGYKRPPKHTQFKRGSSGNITGRPRGSKSLKADLRDELNELVRIREGGREIEITKQRAIIKALVSSAIEREARAIAAFFSICSRSLGNEPDDEPDRPPSADDFELVKDFVAREEQRRAVAEKEKKSASPPVTPTSGEPTNEK